MRFAVAKGFLRPPTAGNVNKWAKKGGMRAVKGVVWVVMFVRNGMKAKDMYRSGPGFNRAGLTARLALVAGLLAVSAPAFPAPLDRPGGNAPANPVSPGLLRKIAVATAERISGEKLTMGKPIPYCNLAGEIIAYEFPFCRDCRSFPSDTQVQDELRAARERADAPRGGKYKKQVWGVGKYWTVVLSATEDRTPLLEAMEGLSRFHTMADPIAAKARGRLGRGAKLGRIFYASPLDQFYEFSDGTGAVWVDPFSLRIAEPGAVRERASGGARRDIVRKRWKKMKAMVE